MSNRVLCSLTSGVFLLSLTIFDPFLPKAQAQKMAHPRLHRAIYEMEQAEKELEEAPKIFGGHKAKAIEAMHAASEELKLALEAVGEPYRGWKGKEAGKGGGAHPRISSAINELREAESYLKSAKHDFKGHKVKAMKDIHVAIEQLEAALAFAGGKKKK